MRTRLARWLCGPLAAALVAGWLAPTPAHAAVVHTVGWAAPAANVDEVTAARSYSQMLLELRQAIGRPFHGNTYETTRSTSDYVALEIAEAGQDTLVLYFGVVDGYFRGFTTRSGQGLTTVVYFNDDNLSRAVDPHTGNYELDIDSGYQILQTRARRSRIGLSLGRTEFDEDRNLLREFVRRPRPVDAPIATAFLRTATLYSEAMRFQPIEDLGVAMYRWEYPTLTQQLAALENTWSGLSSYTWNALNNHNPPGTYRVGDFEFNSAADALAVLLLVLVTSH